MHAVRLPGLVSTARWRYARRTSPELLPRRAARTPGLAPRPRPRRSDRPGPPGAHHVGVGTLAVALVRRGAASCQQCCGAVPCVRGPGGEHIQLAVSTNDERQTAPLTLRPLIGR